MAISAGFAFARPHLPLLHCIRKVRLSSVAAFETIDEPESLIKGNGDHDSVGSSGRVEGDCKTPEWKRLSSKELGISNSSIARPIRVVLNGLKRKDEPGKQVQSAIKIKNTSKSHVAFKQLLLKSIPSCFELKCRAYSLLSQCYHLLGAIPSQKQILNNGLALTASSAEGSILFSLYPCLRNEKEFVSCTTQNELNRIPP